MQPPDALLKRGITSLPTLGDGRQSGTSDSPSILNARRKAPRAAASRGCAPATASASTSPRARCDMLVGDEEIARRKSEGLPPVPESATPWQELYRATVGPARQRRRHGDGGQISRRRQEDAAPQSLVVRGLMSPPRLTEASLHSARSGTILPTYDRGATRFGIVHIGPGAFHRAHQALLRRHAAALRQALGHLGAVAEEHGPARCAEGPAGPVHAGRARRRAARTRHRRDPRTAGRRHRPRTRRSRA